MLNYAELSRSASLPQTTIKRYIALLEATFLIHPVPAWSSNRSKRVGHSVAFIPFKKGKPSGPMEDFLTGWMLSPDKPEVWGRPTGLLQMPDGSLLVSEDGNNKIYHISYKGK